MEAATCPRCGTTVEVVDGEFWPHPKPGSDARCPGSREPAWLIELRPHLTDIETTVTRELGRPVEVWIDEDFPQVVLTLDYHQQHEVNAIFRVASEAMATWVCDPPDDSTSDDAELPGPEATELRHLTTGEPRSARETATERSAVVGVTVGADEVVESGRDLSVTVSRGVLVDQGCTR
jgi:hypothetical protein